MILFPAGVGQGFLPGSELSFTTERGEPPAPGPPIRADQNGKIPEAGSKVGVLRDLEPQRVAVDGTDPNGVAAHFELLFRPDSDCSAVRIRNASPLRVSADRSEYNT